MVLCLLCKAPRQPRCCIVAVSSCNCPLSMASYACGWPGLPLSLGHHVISEDADVADLDFDDVARDHVAVSPLGAHPEHIAWVEGGVPAQLLNPGRRIPDLVGRREVLPDRAVMAHDNAELGGVQPGDNAGPKWFEGVAILAAKHGPIAPLPHPLTDIVPDAVAKDVLQGVVPGDVACLLTDHHRQLSLGLHCSRTLFWHN